MLHNFPFSHRSDSFEESCLSEMVIARQSESTNSKTFPRVTNEISRPLLENRIEALLRDRERKQHGQRH
jgi:hypothetical protein